MYDIASREALAQSLSSHRNRYLFSSEITPILKNATRESTSTLLDGLIHLWDNPNTFENNSLAARKSGGNISENPTLNFYGGIQPARMSEEMTDNVMTSGLGNRLAVYMGEAKNRMAEPPDLDLDRAGELYMDLWDAIQSYTTGTQIRLSPACTSLWQEWFDAQTYEDDELANDMKVRHPVMVRKWALMFAVTDRSKQIEPWHLEPAMAICGWMWSNIRRVLPSWGVSTERKIEERVMTVVRAKEPISKRYLTQMVRGRWTSREVASVLRSLKETQQIVFDSTDTHVCTPEFAERQRKGAA
jgi:hypothetical protein